MGIISQIQEPPTTSDLNEWLFLAAVSILAGAVMVLARYIAQLVRQLTSGMLVPRDVVTAESRLTEALSQVAAALTESSSREREYMRWIEHRNENHQHN